MRCCPGCAIITPTRTPSHSSGRKAKAAVEFAREQVAALLPPGGRVVFTSGATEALNWAIKGSPKGNVVTIATEHAAVLDTVETLREKRTRNVTILPVGPDGLVDTAAPLTVRVCLASGRWWRCW